jgi:FAD-dependent urate hydroxylase
LLARLNRIDGAPMLGRGFESSVAGLHFIGASAVRSYGPVLRFIAGCGHAARGVTSVIAAQRPHDAWMSLAKKQRALQRIEAGV